MDAWNELADGAHGQKNPVRIVAQLGKSVLPIKRQRGVIFRFRDHGERSNVRGFLVRTGERIHEKQRARAWKTLITR